MSALADVRVFEGEGTSERVWQRWLAEANVKALSQDKRPDQRRLVVISPHPDDEVLACGGLLASHARQGGRSTVIALTDGEASHAGDRRWPAKRLAAARRVESERGLARLGISPENVIRLGLPDGGVAEHSSALRSALRSELRPDDLVVSTWRIDGHPDHDAAGEEAERVCTELELDLLQAPVWMWHWSRPRDAHIPWGRLRAVALSAESLQIKHSALAEHVTQLESRFGNAGPVLGTQILLRVARQVEYFFV